MAMGRRTKMPRWIVEIHWVGYEEVEVEADTWQEAEDKAREDADSFFAELDVHNVRVAAAVKDGEEGDE